jgi:hypothetical protein
MVVAFFVKLDMVVPPDPPTFKVVILFRFTPVTVTVVPTYPEVVVPLLFAVEKELMAGVAPPALTVSD